MLAVVRLGPTVSSLTLTVPEDVVASIRLLAL